SVEGMDTEKWEAVGLALYLAIFYSVKLAYYTFKAALEHGGPATAAIVLVVLLGLGLTRRF
ncbi:MAG: hypothetical protein AB7O68_25900, partial [Pirellulales bacterium]